MRSPRDVLLIASGLLLMVPESIPAQTGWSTFAPPGEGFSIEVPGESRATGESGHYIYGVDNWTFIIKVDPISPAVRDLVEGRQREALASFLQRIAGGMVGKATVVASSSEDFAGYPSLLIFLEDEAENLTIQGINRLVLTEQHLYMLITVGRRDAPRTDADHFLDSFRLLATASAPPAGPAPSAPPPTNPLVARMAGPMLAVARMITEEELSSRIDELVQNAPPAARLGDRWNSSHAAWQQARGSITGRMDRLFELYETTGQLTRLLESELARLASGSEANALAAALNGPAGDAILRSCAMIHFMSSVGTSDPNSPRVGEPAYREKMRSLAQAFNARAGSAMPVDDRQHEAEVSQFLNSPTYLVSMNLWNSVVGKSTVELTGAINLMVFDDRENIWREIEAAIAAAK